MASLTLAYSNEYGEIIDPELAYDLFWAGTITDKTQFQCPSEFCNGKVTCANLDVEKQDMYQSPHFRGYNHSPECDALIDNKSSPTIDLKNKKSLSTQEKAKLKPDLFRLTRPKSQFVLKEGVEAASGKKNAIKAKNEKVKGLNGNKFKSEYYSVRSLVSNFIKYRKSDELTSHMVNISGDELSYKSLFKGVYEQKLDLLPNKKLIYWGVAFIDLLEEKGVYKINFAQKFTYDDKQIRPSFFISQAQIDAYPVKSLVLKRLKTISESKEKRGFVFLYSKPFVKNEKYLNFDLESLDYLEIRYLDLFDELKK